MASPRLIAASLAAGAALAGPALAEGYAIHDLGEVASREVCMQRATKILNAYVRQEGGSAIDPTDWIVYGWDLAPGDNDVTILCPIFRDEFVNAMMVVYGELDGPQSDADRDQVAATLDRMWFN